MSSLLARSTGIRNPRVPRADETPSPVISEGFQSEIVEQQQEEQPQQLGRKCEEIPRQRRLPGYRAANSNLNVKANTHANSNKTKEVVEGWRPAQRMIRDSTLKSFPTESTREVWLTNDPKNVEKACERVFMVGDSERHHLELAKLCGLSVSEGGKVLDDDGRVIGQVVDGQPQELIGRTGYEDGYLLGRVDVFRAGDDHEGEGERDKFQKLEGLKVNKQGNVIGADGVPAARVVGENRGAIAGREVGKDGRIRDCNGTVLAEVVLIPVEERNECDRALRAHCSDGDEIEQQLAELINELGKSVIETINNACQIIADSQNTYHIYPLIMLFVEPPLHITATIALKIIGVYARILNTVAIGKTLRTVLRRVGIYKQLEEFGLGAVLEVLELGSGK
ncbi:hypothetical protein BJY01DRAFT_252816 [Aspergillus pseudoustus]|uniref:DUF6987 domain-containing protein n=1 Tax=Aspergillus pseudoustus TaxID=1810923 RepID=A0ABR4J4V8_9EURO